MYGYTARSTAPLFSAVWVASAFTIDSAGKMLILICPLLRRSTSRANFTAVAIT
jgi:hypothetical protein